MLASIDWPEVAGGGLITAVIILAAIRRWRVHDRNRLLHFEIRFDWHSRQRDEGGNDEHRDDGSG